jgi:hypothetical protein
MERRVSLECSLEIATACERPQLATLRAPVGGAVRLARTDSGVGSICSSMDNLHTADTVDLRKVEFNALAAHRAYHPSPCIVFFLLKCVWSRWCCWSWLHFFFLHLHLQLAAPVENVKVVSRFFASASIEVQWGLFVPNHATCHILIFVAIGVKFTWLFNSASLLAPLHMLF